MKTFSLLLALLLPALAQAQQPVAQSWTLEFTQRVDVAPAADYTHLVSIDGGALAPLARTCTVAGACEAPLPALTPGTHALRLVSRRVVGGVAFDAEASPADDTLSVALIVVQGPTNILVKVRP